MRGDWFGQSLTNMVVLLNVFVCCWLVGCGCCSIGRLIGLVLGVRLNGVDDGTVHHVVYSMRSPTNRFDVLWRWCHGL
jgi:hypothetical protein